jgi:anaerobic magnesium-protoporphyrin IX monomethyl ester cyclase
MRTLLIDLNNFSRYPTLSVGYLTAILRNAGHEVEVLSPLSFGVHGFPRQVREHPSQRYTRFLSHWSAVTTLKPVHTARSLLKRNRQIINGQDAEIILEAVKISLTREPQVVLISAYTMYHEVCSAIAKLCREKNIPVIVGGNSFVVPEIAERWAQVAGISAVFSGEPEPILLDLITKVTQGEDVRHIPGVYDKQKCGDFSAPPLRSLDDVPFPDFSDFPWNSYPNRIIPIMTGRGCEWGRCTFCSDVLTSAGRTFRSRSLDNVLQEIQYQRARFGNDLFVFLDLKLNSDLPMWRGLAEHLPKIAPGIRWTASVHVDSRQDNGLTAEDLQRAAQAGLVRITCGLESGSQRVLSSMAKGVRLNRMSTFIKDASAAGISVRLTGLLGYPSEETEDIEKTTDFIAEHRDYIERVTLHRFSLMPGVPVQDQLKKQPETYPHIAVANLDVDYAVIPHRNQRLAKTRNLIATYRLIRITNQINCKPLLERAREFEGAF